ncbi:MAG TPA: ABC transporter permease [Hyphomicrobiaceae bacterium]|nr:ABC transporter permease [Hyphomicrobiaceae bacterium]
MNLASYLRSALSAIRLNAMRSMLTALGVIIGVASVIIMSAIGSGARQEVERSISRLGTNMLTISPGSARTGPSQGGAGTAPPLSEDDISAIEARITDAVGVTASLSVNATVVFGNQNWSTSITGASASYPFVRDWEVADGRFFDAAEVARGAKLAVVGSTVARQLFGGGVAIGERIRISGAPFEVIGVMETRGQAGGFRDQDDIVFIPITTGRARLVGQSVAVPNQVGSILVKIADGGDLALAQEEISSLLKQRRRIRPGEQDDFRIRNVAEIVQARTAAQRTLTWLLAATAAVSLIVGGIGIMNIMLVSVTERTREIGLRMAVGARRRDILAQFLTESIVLCLSGGLIGLLLGVGATYVISSMAGWPVLISSMIIVIGIGASATVGIAFGYIPARKAAHLNPIDALRYE